MASVLVRSRRFWNNSPERALTNTATVQEDAPRDVGPSAIGRRAKVCKVLGWCQLASVLQMRRKTQVFRLLRTRGFFGIASSIKSLSNEGKELIIQCQTKSSLCQASSSKPRCPLQRTPGNLVRSSECLSKCCHAFNPTCDQEECDCR